MITSNEHAFPSLQSQDSLLLKNVQFKGEFHGHLRPKSEDMKSKMLIKKFSYLKYR